MTADYAALGLYDPDAPHAEERLLLIEFLVGQGATIDDLVAYRDQLPGLALVIALRGGRALTLAEVVARSGLPEEKVRRLNRAAGFPDPGEDDRVFAGQFADAFGSVAVAEGMFGEDAVLQLVRVMGAAMARVADAGVSAFLVNVEPGARAEDPVGLGIARANADAAAILPGVVNLLDAMLRQHLIAARRTILGDIEGLAFETQHLYVGFVDVVGSTALAQRLPPAELGSVLTEFENTASDAVTANRGRVVKLIGDEVLYSAPDVAAAFAIARTLTSTYLDHPRLPKVRAGIAGGEVMLRDGDVFGPVVNLAARAVKAAGPDEIVAPSAIATEAGIDTEPLGPQALKGFDGEVPLARLLPDSPG